MKPLRDCRLYAFIDTAYLHGRDPAELARQLCDGGADLVQLRAKGASTDEVRRLAEALLPVMEKAGVGLVINDHPHVALTVGAPVVHLGQEDFFAAGFTQATEVTTAAVVEQASSPVPVRQATRLTAGRIARRIEAGESPAPLSRMLLGLSTHAPEQAKRALAAGPDYIAIGPVFATPTKPGRPPVTLDYVRWAAAHVSIPWFAIGGITLQTLDDVLAAGATRICVVSAILNAADVAKACQEFRKRLPSAPRKS